MTRALHRSPETRSASICESAARASVRDRTDKPSSEIRQAEGVAQLMPLQGRKGKRLSLPFRMPGQRPNLRRAGRATPKRGVSVRHRDRLRGSPQVQSGRSAVPQPAFEIRQGRCLAGVPAAAQGCDDLASDVIATISPSFTA